MQRTKGFSVRKAEHEDTFQILVLCYNFAKEAPDIYRTFDNEKVEQNIASFVESEFSEIFVLEENGVIIGMLACIISEFLFSHKRVANELAWYVDKEHRGGTKALRLIKTYEDWAKSKGANIISMSDLSQLQELGGLYKRLGYHLSESSYSKEI